MLCPLCKNESRKIYTGHPGYQEGIIYDIYECSSCGTSYVFPMETSAVVYEMIYKQIDLVPGYSRYYKYASKIASESSPLDYLLGQEESYWAAAKYLRQKRSNGDNIRVLEVGCGTGYFTYALCRDGFDAHGIDISLEAVQKAKKKFGEMYTCSDIESMLRQDTRRYNVIVMNQLIEHVPDILSFMRKTFDLLEEDGDVVITTPNKSVYPHAIWETDLPPVHLWWLSEKSFEYMAKTLNVSVIFSDFEEFYRQFYRQKSIPELVELRKSVFDPGGNLRIVSHNNEPTFVNNLAEVSGLKGVYRYLRDRATGKTRWAGSKGPIIAAILKKDGRCQ